MFSKRKRHIFKGVIVDKKAVCALAFVIFLFISCFAMAKLSDAFFSILPSDVQDMLKAAAAENIIPSCSDGKRQIHLVYEVFCKAAGFDIKEPRTIVHSQFAALKVASDVQKQAEVKQDVTKEENKTSKEDLDRYPIAETSSIVGAQSGSGANKLVYLNNETDFSVDINSLLEQKLSITKKDGPLVLIVHTHTTESYTPSGQYSYSPEESTRTQDTNYNVVRVGEVVADELKSAGINTIHDKTINDYPSYNGSYVKTLGIIESYLEKYPSIQVVLDIHRDGMTKKDGTKMKVCAEVNGEKASQVMVLCGSSEGGLSHPDWKENLKLGLRIQNILTLDYPGLARPLQLVRERYNQHATHGSLILEVGTDGNTLEEAMVCAKYTGKAIAKVLSKI